MGRVLGHIDEQHPLVMGVVSVGAIVVPLGLLMQAGIWFNEWAWTESTSPTWELPYLIGILIGLLYVLYVNRLLRSRAAEWYAYFEAWTTTQQYPTENDDE